MDTERWLVESPTYRPYGEDSLHCDYCSVIECAADLTPDWNGETGNHLSCEREQLVGRVCGRHCQESDHESDDLELLNRAEREQRGSLRDVGHGPCPCEWCNQQREAESFPYYDQPDDDEPVLVRLPSSATECAEMATYPMGA